MENNKECEHLFIAVKRDKQQRMKRANWLSAYDFTTLTQEEIYLYCEKCWENKKITEELKDSF